MGKGLGSDPWKQGVSRGPLVGPETWGRAARLRGGAWGQDAGLGGRTEAELGEIPLASPKGTGPLDPGGGAQGPWGGTGTLGAGLGA